MTPRLFTNQESQKLSHWFTQIDNDTIELREKRWGSGKLGLLLLFLVFFCQSFISPKYRDMMIHKLTFTFQPETRFEKSWNRAKNPNNPEFTLDGDSKKEYMRYMKERHKSRNLDGYYVLLPYVIVFLLCSLPSKRRFRFDRRRGIIYTYDKGKLHVTEINKLMRPLAEFMRLDIYGVSMWIHPYAYPKGMRSWIPWPGFMMFSDSSIWQFFFTRQFQLSKAFFMQAVIIEFMNPKTEPEHLAKLQQAIAKKPSWLRFFLTWIDMGLYCKRLPKQAIIEEKLTTYFNEVAPTIKAHPSWYYLHESDMRFWRKGMFCIVSVEENKETGFDKVPCPTLFEMPKQSMHYGSVFSIESYREKYNKIRDYIIRQEQ